MKEEVMILIAQCVNLGKIGSLINDKEKVLFYAITGGILIPFASLIPTFLSLDESELKPLEKLLLFIFFLLWSFFAFSVIKHVGEVFPPESSLPPRINKLPFYVANPLFFSFPSIGVLSVIKKMIRKLRGGK
jgi:hypothetical protein